MQFKSNFPILIAHRRRRRAVRRGRPPAADPARARGRMAGRPSSSTTRQTPASSPARIAGSRPSSSAPSGAGAIRHGQADRRADEQCTSARPGLPIIALGESGTDRGQVAARRRRRCATCHSILYLYEDTVPFLARQIMRAADDYLDNLLPPFFKALDAPCRALGLLVAHARTRRRRRLPEVAGRATRCTTSSARTRCARTCRSRCPNWARCSTTPARSRKPSSTPPQVFGADHTYFVTNGTSTANKIVWHSMAGRDDLVIVRPQLPQVAAALADHDRRDADLLHAGAQRLRHHRPDRAGPVLAESIKKKIAASPIARGAEGQGAHRGGHQLDLRRPLLQRREDQGQVGDQVDALHFDEAWYAYAASTSSTRAATGWACRAAIRAPTHTLVFATQSTHKLLAAFSQASMIHIQESEAQDRHHALQRRVHDARVDLAALRDHRLARRQLGDDGRPSGRSIVRRRTTRRCTSARRWPPSASSFKSADWWFKVWQPDGLAWTNAPKTADWVLDPKARGTASANLARRLHDARPDQGHAAHARACDKGAKLGKTGIPAAVVTKYLWERGLVVEKTGPLQLPDPVLARHHARQVEHDGRRAGRFQDRLRPNAPLAKTLPSVAAARGRLMPAGACATCARQLHACYRDNDTAAA